MRPDQGDAAYLWDMRELCRELLEIAGGATHEDMLADLTLRRALERTTEPIGEAAGRVSPQFKSQHAEIPWSGIIAQRNVLAHQYGEIDYHRIWRVITTDVPELLRNLEPLIPQPPTETDAQ